MKLSVNISEDKQLRTFIKNQIKAAVTSIVRKELKEFILEAINSYIPKTKDRADAMIKGYLSEIFVFAGYKDWRGGPTQKFDNVFRSILREIIHEQALETIKTELSTYKWADHADIDKLLREEVARRVDKLQKI